MKINIWDIPTRVFHWLLAAAYAGTFLTSESESFLDYHTIAGYIALGLVVFRVLWGFTGNRYARFSDFVKGWGEVRAFLGEALKLKMPRYLGHNPAVGWVIAGMLCLTFVICVTGIITYSGEENLGAFAGVFTFGAGMAARQIHHFLADLAIVMIIVHVSAALIHDFVFRENIILSMITGKKEDEESWSERTSHMSAHEGRSALRLAVWIIVTIMGGAALLLLPPAAKTDFTKLDQPRVIDDKGFASRLTPNDVWEAECATSCHNGFHPTLLPADSWVKVMDGLDDHFGDNVSLDPETKAEILAYLQSASAERSTTEASKKLLYYLKPGETPLRITDTAYWKDKHSEIKEDVFQRKSVVSRSNCVACHPGADRGSFEDRDISIPK